MHYDKNHLRTVLADENGAAPDERILSRVAGQVREFMKEQDWQNQVNSLAINLYAEINSLSDQPDPKSTPARVHTDGACMFNPGPGGWAAIITREEGSKVTRQGRSPMTTSNRMEMQAVIEGIKSAGAECNISIHTDSMYIVRAFKENWFQKWAKTDWKTQKDGPVLNQDLWKQILQAVAGKGRRKCRFIWVKGHSGDSLNEQADLIAKSERDIAIKEHGVRKRKPVLKGR